ncbi:MAG: hypothetical protein KDE27_25545 [Planctomycetes bacterium]|nr:hypothetical protein [Planctomycetota bacterium]
MTRVAKSWRRRVHRAAMPISALIGILVVFGAVMFIENISLKIALIGFGLLVMQTGVWYMANPIFTSERKFPALRIKVDEFIGLVRDLNQAVVSGRPAAEVDAIAQAMHRAVDAMPGLAGQGDRIDGTAAVDREPVA